MNLEEIRQMDALHKYLPPYEGKSFAEETESYKAKSFVEELEPYVTGTRVDARKALSRKQRIKRSNKNKLAKAARKQNK